MSVPLRLLARGWGGGGYSYMNVVYMCRREFENVGLRERPLTENGGLSERPLTEKRW